MSSSIPADQDNENARNAYERLKSLAQGLTARQASRTACRLSKWANPPTHAQWGRTSIKRSQKK